MIIIFSPHVDDEMIGCWRLLTRYQSKINTETLVVAYCEPTTEARKAEGWKAGEEFHFEVCFKAPTKGLYSFIETILDVWEEEKGVEVSMVWAPDPHWELHPAHKAVGALVWGASERRGIRFGTYSTSMNAPYLLELDPEEADLKKAALDRLYPSQKSLWAADFKYFLFEGRSEWNPTD